PLCRTTGRRSDDLLEFGAPLGVAGDDLAALVVLDDLGFLCHSAFFPEFDMPADHRVVLLQHEPVGVVAPVLAGDVGIAGARSGTELDFGPNIVARHQIRSPALRSRATTASMPSRSTTLIPLVLSRSVIRRPSEGR